MRLFRKMAVLFSMALALCGCTNANTPECAKECHMVHFILIGQCYHLESVEMYDNGAYIEARPLGGNGFGSVSGFYPYGSFFLVRGNECIICDASKLSSPNGMTTAGE